MVMLRDVLRVEIAEPDTRDYLLAKGQINTSLGKGLCPHA